MPEVFEHCPRSLSPALTGGKTAKTRAANKEAQNGDGGSTVHQKTAGRGKAIEAGANDFHCNVVLWSIGGGRFLQHRIQAPRHSEAVLADGLTAFIQ